MYAGAPWTKFAVDAGKCDFYVVDPFFTALLVCARFAGYKNLDKHDMNTAGLRVERGWSLSMRQRAGADVWGGVFCVL